MSKPQWHEVAWTREQLAELDKAKSFLRDAVNRLGRGGMDPAIIVDALSDTTAEAIATQFGSDAIEPFFEAKAKLYGPIADEAQERGAF